MIYTKSIKQLHLESLKEHPNIYCSRSTFVKYRSFYIEVPTVREKERKTERDKERERSNLACALYAKMHIQNYEVSTFFKSLRN